jgi:hypothetical protein
MFKVKIYAFGKAREPWLVSALEEYEKRLAPRAKIEWIIAKEGVATEAKMVHETVLIALDLRGEEGQPVVAERRVSDCVRDWRARRIAFQCSGKSMLAGLLFSFDVHESNGAVDFIGATLSSPRDPVRIILPQVNGQLENRPSRRASEQTRQRCQSPLSTPPGQTAKRHQAPSFLPSQPSKPEDKRRGG